MNGATAESAFSSTSLTSTLHALTQRCEEAILARSNGCAVIEGTASPAVYARYLVTAHEAVQRAEDFLLASAEQLEQEGGVRELSVLLREKACEERGHERWIERDLEVLGYALHGANAPTPAPAGRLYVDFHRGLRTIRGAGAGFLGTAFVLESLATRLAGCAAANLRAQAALPELRAGKGLSFLRGHDAEDHAHVQSLVEVLERHVTRSMDRDFIKLCACFTASIYPAFFD